MNELLLSVVIPIFNEEENIEPLVQELIPILQKTTVFSHYEIIMVNDGSTDLSWQKIIAASHHHPEIKGIRFTRNFGQEYTLSAGLKAARGDAVMILDADLQDPPELIFEFEREFQNGYDIVYGLRTERLEESIIKKTTSKLFYSFFRFLTKIDMPRNVGEFSLLSRKAVDIFINLPEKSRFVRGLIYWPGLPKKAVPFIRRKRNRGTSKYNYYKLLIAGFENIVSFSTTPIHYLIFLSLMMTAACTLGTFSVFWMHYMGKVIMSGWTSIMICMLTLFSYTFFILGALGLYIGKIFQEVKRRPEFLVGERCGFEEPPKTQIKPFIASFKEQEKDSLF